MSKDRRAETLLSEIRSSGVKRFSKYPLYRILCKAYDNKRSKKENLDELHCEGNFTTRNPDREFCGDNCRVRFWTKYNKDKAAAKQKRYRDNQKKKFNKMVQDIIDSKGIQEN